MTTDELVGEVLRVLRSAEAAMRRFAPSSGFTCPPGCGDCCRDDHPHDSVLAALPAARWAIDRGLYEALERYGEAQGGPCVFYNPAADRHCDVYGLRPLVCRLFGFAGTRDKHGKVRYGPCRRMVPAPARGGACPPVFGDWAARLEGLEPSLGWVRLPLGAAFLHAARWLVQRRLYERGETAAAPQDRAARAPDELRTPAEARPGLRCASPRRQARRRGCTDRPPSPRKRPRPGSA